jgi:hypothetical protein
MSTIILRSVKGSSLTFEEGDANFDNLNTDKIEAVADDTAPALGGDLDVGDYAITTTSENDEVTIQAGGVILTAEYLGIGLGDSTAYITSFDNTSDLELNTNGSSTNSKIVLSAGANGDITLTPNGTGSVVLDGQSWPQAAPTTNGEYLEGNTDGTLAWTDSVKAKTIYENVKNVSGGSLAKGTPVTQVGVVGVSTVTVEAARADDPTKLAIGVLNETLADEAEGQMTILGEIRGVNTSGFTVGDKVYLGATGGYTNVKPTATDVAVQFLGVVFRVDATTGSGFITGTLVEDSVRYTGTAFEFWDGSDWISLPAPGIANVVDDTTPQLGGDLDVGVNSIITSVENGDITIAPDGEGLLIVQSEGIRVGAGTSPAGIVTPDDTSDLVLATNDGDSSASIVISAGTNADIEITPNGTGAIVLDGLSWPTADGTADQVLTTDGAGNLSWEDAGGGGGGGTAFPTTAYYDITQTISVTTTLSKRAMTSTATKYDPNNILGANATTFTLAAGTYLINANYNLNFSGGNMGDVSGFIVNTTDSVDVYSITGLSGPSSNLPGTTSAFSTAGTGNPNRLLLTLAASKTFSPQYAVGARFSTANLIVRFFLEIIKLA